jgi:L-ascorbate metabolism protein UlaG (beta-lactamase superfamily)
LVVLIALAVVVFMQQPQFGRVPSGDRLERIKRSPNFRNGKFQNIHDTPALTDGANYFSVMNKFVFKKKERVKPKDPIPHLKTDLKSLLPDANVLVWFGHSSYFLQVNGKKLLVDPVLSGAASPAAFTTRSFSGTDPYSVDDIPEIDYLFITHDHWDHLDHTTILKLRSKVKQVICSLGTGEHFEYWGFDAKIIRELDWNESTTLDSGFTVTATSARHFSGRKLARNKALWTSYVLQTPTQKIFLGGDSGYDTHFAEIGTKHGPFDLAILENGQYDKSWKYIHMMPEEVVQAAQELRARKLLAVHSGKFALANHAWDDPLKRVSLASAAAGMRLLTPMIGEQVNVDAQDQPFVRWWEGVD